MARGERKGIPGRAGDEGECGRKGEGGRTGEGKRNWSVEVDRRDRRLNGGAKGYTEGVEESWSLRRRVSAES